MGTHHILKDGTSYTIKGGTDLIAGTSYQIGGGSNTGEWDSVQHCICQAVHDYDFWRWNIWIPLWICGV